MTELDFKYSIGLLPDSVFLNQNLIWTEDLRPGTALVLSDIEKTIRAWADTSQPDWDLVPETQDLYEMVIAQLQLIATNLEIYENDTERSLIIYDFINAAKSVWLLNQQYQDIDNTALTLIKNEFKICSVIEFVDLNGYSYFENLENITTFNTLFITNINTEKTLMKTYIRNVLSVVRKKIMEIILDDPEFVDSLNAYGIYPSQIVNY